MVYVSVLYRFTQSHRVWLWFNRVVLSVYELQASLHCSDDIGLGAFHV